MDEQAYNDRFLHDFSAGFGLIRGGKDGYQDAGVPDWWYNEFLALQREEKAQKESVVISGNGFNIQYDNTSNAVIIQAGGRAHIELSGTQWPEFVQAVLRVNIGGSTNVPVGYGGQSSAMTNHMEKDDRPEVQENRRRNNERMMFALKQLEKQMSKAR